MRLIALLLALFCAPLPAQQPAALSTSMAVRGLDGPPIADMDERTLVEKYHIQPAKEGLLSALHHPNSSVRTFAAGSLARDGYKDAIPSILGALSTEPVPGGQVHLASAAARLGAEDGFVALESMCQQLDWTPILRMTAVRSLLDLGREECLSTILTVLGSAPNGQDAAFGFNLLPRFRHLSPTELEEVRNCITVSLKSDLPLVRMEASYALSQIGGSWATEVLQNALAVEPDEAVRQVLASRLAHMQAS